MMTLLEKMDKREATVLKMRFGLEDEEPKTLKEIGECLGLTRERVRQIESEALCEAERKPVGGLTVSDASKKRMTAPKGARLYVAPSGPWRY